MARTVLVNGQLSESGLIQIDADDEGLLLGRSVFETLRTYEHQIFALEDHVERLVASASVMQISPPSFDAIAEEIVWVASTIDEESVVRVTLTAGGTRVVRATTLPVIPHPFHCATRCFVPPAWLDGTVKHTSRAYSRLAVLEADVDEVLWVDEDGCVLEGTRSNVFAVRDGVLYTPAVDGRFLSGVTRSFLIESAEIAGVTVRLETLRDVHLCDELYVSSTLKELTGIDSVDGVPTRGAGPVGRRVLDAFQTLLRSHLT